MPTASSGSGARSQPAPSPTGWPAIEASAPARWVWSDTPRWYAELLAAGVRLARCHDLRLCHAILRDSALVGCAGDRAHGDRVGRRSVRRAGRLPAGAVRADRVRSHPGRAAGGRRRRHAGVRPPAHRDRGIHRSRPTSAAHRRRICGCARRGGTARGGPSMGRRGARGDPHGRARRAAVGRRHPRQAGGRRPPGPRSAERAGGEPRLPAEAAAQSLHRAGILVESTSRWELAEYRHPVIEPLLEYKKLSRLLSANGWSWLAEWVHDGRFRPVYVPGGRGDRPLGVIRRRCPAAAASAARMRSGPTPAGGS